MYFCFLYGISNYSILANKTNNSRREKLYVCQTVLDDVDKRLIYCITIRLESS